MTRVVIDARFSSPRAMCPRLHPGGAEAAVPPPMASLNRANSIFEPISSTASAASRKHTDPALAQERKCWKGGVGEKPFEGFASTGPA